MPRRVMSFVSPITTMGRSNTLYPTSLGISLVIMGLSHRTPRQQPIYSTVCIFTSSSLSSVSMRRADESIITEAQCSNTVQQH